MVNIIELIKEPVFWEIIAATLVLIALLVWRHQNPEQYKTVKKEVLKIKSTGFLVFYVIGATVALISLSGIAVYFYSENTILAIKSAAPDLYAFIEGYLLAVMVAFLIYNFLLFMLKIVTHHWGGLSNGIIDDPEQVIKNAEIDDQLYHHSVNTEANTKSIGELHKKMTSLSSEVETMRQFFLKYGIRKEENTPVEERRIVPYYVPSEDGVKLIDPTKRAEQEETPAATEEVEKILKNEVAPMILEESEVIVLEDDDSKKKVSK